MQAKGTGAEKKDGATLLPMAVQSDIVFVGGNDADHHPETTTMTTTPTATPTTTPADFQAALATFLLGIKARTDARYAASYPSLTAPTYTVDPSGRKYLRIVVNDAHGTSRSVFCFVRVEDGAVLKAEGWKKPAKHARGSIYVNGGMDAVTEYGANYMR
jgi:hypothetical protein